jgi:hypothetical protein
MRASNAAQLVHAADPADKSLENDAAIKSESIIGTSTTSAGGQSLNEVVNGVTKFENPIYDMTQKVSLLKGHTAKVITDFAALPKTQQKSVAEMAKLEEKLREIEATLRNLVVEASRIPGLSRGNAKALFGSLVDTHKELNPLRRLANVPEMTEEDIRASRNRAYKRASEYPESAYERRRREEHDSYLARQRASDPFATDKPKPVSYSRRSAYNRVYPVPQSVQDIKNPNVFDQMVISSQKASKGIQQVSAANTQQAQTAQQSTQATQAQSGALNQVATASEKVADSTEKVTDENNKSGSSLRDTIENQLNYVKQIQQAVGSPEEAVKVWRESLTGGKLVNGFDVDIIEERVKSALGIVNKVGPAGQQNFGKVGQSVKGAANEVTSLNGLLGDTKTNGNQIAATFSAAFAGFQMRFVGSQMFQMGKRLTTPLQQYADYMGEADEASGQ